MPQPDDNWGAPLDPQAPGSGVEGFVTETPPTDEEMAGFDKAMQASADSLPQNDQGDSELREIAQRLEQGSKEPGAAPVAEAAESLTPEKIAERAEAFAGLHRAGLNVEDFASEELAVKNGLALSKAQAKTDEKFAERREKGREAPVDPGQPAVAPGQTDSHTLEVLTEELGEEAAKKIAPLLTPQRDEALHGQIETLTGWMQGMIVDGFKASDSRINDANWPQVEAQFSALAKSPDYRGPEGMRTAFKHAAQIVLGAPPTEASTAAARVTEEAKANGRMTSAAREITDQVPSELEGEYASFLAAGEMSVKARAAQLGQT